jgi:3-oxoadipate enol-lactonase
VRCVTWSEVNGVRLYYERGGAGPPLLFISGTGGDLRNKPSVFDGPLVRTFEVLAYDQRGLGQSDVPAGPYSMADYADDAAALLASVGWTSCVVMGVSFGGMVAQELAIRHPDRVQRLVLACTSAGGAGGASYPLHTLVELEGEARVIRQLEIADTRWNAEWRSENPGQWQQMVDLMTAQLASSPSGFSGSPAEGPALQLEARSHHDTSARLGRITCPTLVCGGRYDGIAPQSNSEFLAGTIPGAELALFEGGHMFLLQDREAFPVMVEFLQR